METYIFLVQHGYEILKGYVVATSDEDARAKIVNEDWDDVIDTYEADECITGYKILELYK